MVRVVRCALCVYVACHVLRSVCNILASGNGKVGAEVIVISTKGSAYANVRSVPSHEGGC
jgi:hypothetical protein